VTAIGKDQPKRKFGMRTVLSASCVRSKRFDLWPHCFKLLHFCLNWSLNIVGILKQWNFLRVCLSNNSTAAQNQRRGITEEQRKTLFRFCGTSSVAS
jgi:hypothetical protein